MLGLISIEFDGCRRKSYYRNASVTTTAFCANSPLPLPLGPVVSGQWSVVSGQWAVGSGQLPDRE